MKIKHPCNLNDHLVPFLRTYFALSWLWLSAAGASAAALYWDAGNLANGPAPDPGSGAWDTSASNTNWNDGITGNTAWTQISTQAGTNVAIFNGPDGADGAYFVNVDNGQVAVTNLTINAAGYAFSGSPIYIRGGWTPAFSIADGKSVTFTNIITGNNAVAQVVLGSNGAPAAASFIGGMTTMQWNVTSTNGSVCYIGGNSSSGSLLYNADVRMTNGTFTSTGIFQVARAGGSSWQSGNKTGSFLLDGPATVLNETGDFIIVGRGTTGGSPGVQATMTIQNGATLNDLVPLGKPDPGMGLPRVSADGGGPNWTCVLNVFGGTVNMGSPSLQANPITLQDVGSWPGEVSLINQTNGVINAWGGIVFGGSGSTRTGGSAIVTNSGGFLYLGSVGGDGLRAGQYLPPTNVIALSGGTVGALQSWHAPASLPITLGALNGNATFQCADPNQNPYNITLDQSLNGPGGFYKTGGGQLILNGINTYAGSTVVSNGILQLTTSSIASSNGPVTLDGSAGSPGLALKVSNTGQYWSVGALAFANGAPAIDFQFPVSQPSTTVAVIQDQGDLDFTAMPTVLATNAPKLGIGTYPLIKYSGNVSGTPPTTVTLPASGYCSGYVSNNATAKVLSLVITQSTYVPLVWSVNNGNWDFTSADWKEGTGFTTYSDGNPVQFDDTAPAPTNITVTLNTSVAPSDVSFNNSGNAYAIVGNGNLDISYPGILQVSGGGTLTVATTNTFSGGTIVKAGSLLNINSGGSNAGTPVGTGLLTLNDAGESGARLGNTSGSGVTVQSPVPQQWNGSFSFVGDSDLNLGSGPVDLAQNTTINTVTNNLTIGGVISDNGAGNQLTKTGNGTLTLATDNNFAGLQLLAGRLNLGSAGAAGSGSSLFTINGGAIDNVSGGPLVLAAGAYTIHPGNGNFTFLGTSDLDLGYGAINGNNGATFAFVVVSNTLTTAGVACQNTTLIKSGNGTWVLGGTDPGNNAIVTVNQGEFDMARNGSPSIGGGGGGLYGGYHGLQVNSNALAKITGYSGNQITHGSYIEVVLNTGGLDLNGHDQGVDMVQMLNGVLRNSAPGSSPTLTVAATAGTHPVNAITLNGTNCQFDVPPGDASLAINAVINGSGALVKTGLGTVYLQQSNNYTGSLTVGAGTLSLAYPDLAPGAMVTIAGNAVLNLNFADADTNTVMGLVTNGVAVAGGLHNAGTDPAFISGSGSLLVVPINPLPGTLQAGWSGATLNLAWPTNAGWLLQAQTNSLAAGLGTNWATVPGSDSTTSLSVPVNPGNGATFYRLVHP